MEILANILMAGMPHFWIVLLPFLIIILYLLITGHASIGPNGHSKTSCCGDQRVERGITVFGGSSAFTFGLHWAVLSYAIGMETPVGMYFASYALLQCILSCIQTITYLMQLAKFRKTNIHVEPLRAHLEGCGFTTAWSPLWILFWVSKIPKFKIVMYIRDSLTIVDWVISIPFVGLLLNPLALLVGKKVIKPEISHVDIPE